MGQQSQRRPGRLVRTVTVHGKAPIGTHPAWSGDAAHAGGRRVITKASRQSQAGSGPGGGRQDHPLSPQALGRPLGQGSHPAVNLAGFVAAQRTTHGIPHVVACRALGVSQAWFYKWRHGDVSLRRAHRRALAAAIVDLFARHRGTYGSPRITDELREAGWRVSENTVAAVMAELHLVARPKRKRRGLTKPDKAAGKAPDLLQRDFTPPAVPNVAWVGDLTEIPNDEGPFYLAAMGVA